MTINKEQIARKVIERNGDKFMTVTFTKLDGTKRTLNGRTGVHSHALGTGTSSQSVVVVWCPHLKAYRSIRPSSIQTIKSRGFNYNLSIFEGD